jgi:thiamine-phosphate pyrophosphorylase
MVEPQETEPKAAARQLYLVVSASCPPANLTAALETADVAGLLVQDGGLDENALRTAIEELCPLAQARDVAVLLQDRPELAAETGCDGVQLSDSKALAAARRRLGAEAIIGIGCGASRHDAMTAAESGADYVAFGALEPDPGPADPELLGWWQELMQQPCIAFGAAAPADCARLATAGADFVAVTPELDLAACQAALGTAPQSR